MRPRVAQHVLGAFADCKWRHHHAAIAGLRTAHCDVRLVRAKATKQTAAIDMDDG